MRYTQVYPTNDFSRIVEMIGNSEKNLDELIKIDEAQPEGSIMYRYFRVPYADGMIFYQVVGLTNTNATILACSGICLDEWMTGEQIVSRKWVEEQIKWRFYIEKIKK